MTPKYADPTLSTTQDNVAASTTTVTSQILPTSTVMPDATFLYPTNALTLNNIDILQLGYQSTWTNVNLTVFCELGSGSNEFALARINELPSSGTYAISPVQAGMSISEFPSQCNLMLYNAENPTDYVKGPDFEMVSTQGLPTVYGISATQTVGITSTTSRSSAGVTSTSRQTSSSSTLGAGAVTTPSPSSSSAPSSVLASQTHASGLSSGAKAGVAVGALLGVIAFVVAAFLLWRKRRRRKDLGTMATLRSDASSIDAVPAEKHVPEPPSPPTISGTGTPGIAVFKIGAGDDHRNSEDWRRFFGNAKTPGRSTPSQD